MPDEYEKGGNDGGGGDEEKEAATIDALLKSSAEQAKESFEQYVELGQRAMRRMTNPKSVSESVADDAQAVLSLMARDALAAVKAWSTYVELSAKKDE